MVPLCSKFKAEPVELILYLATCGVSMNSAGMMLILLMSSVQKAQYNLAIRLVSIISLGSYFWAVGDVAFTAYILATGDCNFPLCVFHHANTHLWSISSLLLVSLLCVYSLYSLCSPTSVTQPNKLLFSLIILFTLLASSAFTALSLTLPNLVQQTSSHNWCLVSPESQSIFWNYPVAILTFVIFCLLFLIVIRSFYVRCKNTKVRIPLHISLYSVSSLLVWLPFILSFILYRPSSIIIFSLMPTKSPAALSSMDTLSSTLTLPSLNITQASGLSLPYGFVLFSTVLHHSQGFLYFVIYCMNTNFLINTPSNRPYWFLTCRNVFQWIFAPLCLLYFIIKYIHEISSGQSRSVYYNWNDDERREENFVG